MKQAALAVAAAAVLSLTSPAFAMDSMAGSSMSNCKAMMSSMSAMATKEHAMMKSKMTGDSDHDVMMMLAGNRKEMMSMLKYESQCGKTEKSRAMAAHMMHGLLDYDAKYPGLNDAN